MSYCWAHRQISPWLCPGRRERKNVKASIGLYNGCSTDVKKTGKKLASWDRRQDNSNKLTLPSLTFPISTILWLNLLICQVLGRAGTTF